ncbi:MAG: hypothetical protein LQ342_005038 [Letrouitia transgressa]|nr:MAG: hypothetical protein LQ342_005038 [Letrouitia transgressa]
MAAATKTKIVLHLLEKSRAQRIVWLLEELNVDYELKTYKRVNRLAPSELKEVHPTGKSPIITIQAEGEAEPLVLAESGLITEYLVDHFGPHLAPTRYQDGKEGQVQSETEEWMRYRYYMHSSEGSLMAFLMIGIILDTIRSGAPFFIKPIANAIARNIESLYLNPTLESHYGFLEEQIKTAPNGGGYLCGSKLTAADIMEEFPLAYAKTRPGFTEQSHPQLWAYVNRLEATESYKKAVQKTTDVERKTKASL